MASFSFGSFGDLVTLIELAYRIYDAGSTNGSLARDLSTSQEYLENLLSVCHSVERTVQAGATPHTDDAIAFRNIINNCSECLRQFASFLDQFQHPRQIVRVSRRLRYCLLRKNVISQFEARLQGFVAILGILQTKFSEQGVKSQIVRSLDEPWDQRPIKFQDALGRRYPLPLEVCGTFNDFLSFLRAAFGMNEGLRNAIVRQQFWLFTPAASTYASASASALWYIISERHWKLACRPGAQIGMSLASSHDEATVLRCTGCKSKICICSNSTYIEEVNTTVKETGTQLEETTAPVSGNGAGSGSEHLPVPCISATQAINDLHWWSSRVEVEAPQPSLNSRPLPMIMHPVHCGVSLPEKDGLPWSLKENRLSTTAKDLNDETVKSVRFSQPLPHWATYDPTTEFKLLRAL